MFIFIGTLDIFPLISMSDVVSLKELTVILRNIGQCDVNSIMTSSIKTITSVLNVSTYIIISITIGCTEILAIMSVSTFKTAVILHLRITIHLYYFLRSCTDMNVVNLFTVGILATGRHVHGHVEVVRQVVQYSV